MFKSVMKEIAIIILLIIAIGLAFVIAFYNYNPISVTIPRKVEAYRLEDKTKAELEETLKAQETQELVKTYIVDSSDLSAYISSGDYEKGKANPFAKYTETTTDENNNTNNNGNNNTTGNGDSGHLLNTVGK